MVIIPREGRPPNGKEVRAHIRRLVRRIRMHWPDTITTIRGDSHYGRKEAPANGPLASGEFSTIRSRLLKVAVRVRETGSRIKLAFAAHCPDAELFRDLICSLIPHPA